MVRQEAFIQASKGLWLCVAYFHIAKEFRDELAPKSKKCIFLGYGESGVKGVCKGRD